MTIFNPRVGIDVQSVNAGGTNTLAAATTVTTTVGRTVLGVSPVAGFNPGSGNPPGAIALSGPGAGDEVEFFATDANSANEGANVTVFLPSGDSLFVGGATSFVLGSFIPSVGGILKLLKISATQWIFG